MANERDRERRSRSSIYWGRDTEKIIKSNKIKKAKGKPVLNLSI